MDIRNQSDFNDKLYQADNNIYALPAVTFFDARTGNPINPFSVDP